MIEQAIALALEEEGWSIKCQHTKSNSTHYAITRDGYNAAYHCDSQQLHCSRYCHFESFYFGHPDFLEKLFAFLNYNPLAHWTHKQLAAAYHKATLRGIYRPKQSRYCYTIYDLIHEFERRRIPLPKPPKPRKQERSHAIRGHRG